MPKAAVSFFLPHPSLRRSISAYYVVEPPEDGREIADLLHPEWANIRLALGGSWTLGGRASNATSPPELYGPTSRASPIRGQGGTGLGVGILPHGWATLVDGAASDLADKVAPLAEFMGDAAASELGKLRSCPDHAARAAALDAFFLARMAARPPCDDIVGLAHAVLMKPEIATVEEFAAALGVSLRQAHRLSLRVFGFPPKLLLQRQRFLRTLAILRQNLDRPWADLIDARYYDQSHLARDFNRFMGMPPSQYFSLRHDMLEPAAAARITSVGQAMQGLQPPIVARLHSLAMSDSSKTGGSRSS
ncbi:MAG: helix-turn-helix domain-containing protein [Rhizomicrobium sp.]